MLNKKFYLALSILIGSTVGGGIFALPYVIQKSGIIPGLFYFLILGGVILLLHLFFGEIILRTKGSHRLIGYSQKYLGNKAKILITFSTVFGVVGILLAYIIIGGDFLKIIFSSFSDLPSFYFSLFFWAVLSYFIFRGITIIAPAELLMNIIFIFIIFFIFLVSLPKFNIQNFTLINPSNIFLPYGVILFAFSGWAAIPIIGEMLKTSSERKDYKKIIILASIIVFLLYSIFTLTVIAVSGRNVSEDALSGLIPFLGQEIVILGAIFGVITTAASFLILGNYLKNSLIYDYDFSKIIAAFIACFLPLILFLIGFRQFIETVGIVGALIGGIEGIIIVLIFQKAKKLGDKKPEYILKIPSFLPYVLILIFILGIMSQIF